MKNQEYIYLHQFEEDDDAEDNFSFCNFQTCQEEPFEFATTTASSDLDQNHPTTPNILFRINYNHPADDQKEEKLKQKHHDKKRDPSLSMIRSASSSSSSSSHKQPSNKYYKDQLRILKNRSSSARYDSYYNSVSSVSNVQKVNITALTSMSSKSRKMMFMFGPVKFMPEMELSAIKERQAKRDPNSNSGMVGKSDEKQWGLSRPSRSRSRLATMFRKPFGCFAVAA